jgi:arsenite methyltransferase
MAGLDENELRELVQKRYAAAARSPECGCGTGDCRQDVGTTDEAGCEAFGASLYADAGPDAADSGILSLGCGVPTKVAGLSPGEVVIDLGSGAGADVLISARRVGPTGFVIGIDMTDEMLEMARRNAADAGLSNVRFVKGYIEELPLPDASVDVAISNCVINLAADKTKVLAEAARVLRLGGRLAISDVIADQGMDNATRTDMQEWTGCVAGALTLREYEAILPAVGFSDVEIVTTHRVHQHAVAAVIRARRGSAGSCCSPAAQAACCEPEAKSECCESGQSGVGACGCR